MEGLIALPTRRRMIRDRIARHPLVTFIALAYALSWTAWFCAYRVDLGATNGLFIIGATGPALAAMILSALLKPDPSGVPAGKNWRLFGMIWALVLMVLVLWRFWIAAGFVTVTGRVVRPAAYPTLPVFLLDVLAAGMVALLLSGVQSPRQGVRDLLHSLNLRQCSVRWYWFVIAVGFYPVVVALGNIITAGLGQPRLFPRATGPWYWLALEALLMFLYVMLGGGGLEEPGWRGFALPLLQKHYSPLRSSLILAVIWAFWHWPMFWLGFYGGGPLQVFFFLLGVAPVAILFTAVFNRTGGSLPIVILLHTSINITPLFLPASTLSTSLWMLLILGMALMMWRSPQAFSSRQVKSRREESLENQL